MQQCISQSPRGLGQDKSSILRVTLDRNEQESINMTRSILTKIVMRQQVCVILLYVLPKGRIEKLIKERRGYVYITLY